MIRPVLAEIAGSWPSAFSLRADVGGAAVLPDDGAVHGRAGGAVPHHGGLALVGDADGGDVACAVTPAFFSASRQVAMVEVQMSSGSCSTQPEAGKCCGNSCLRGRGDGDVGAKHDGARGCGALIDGQHKGHDVASRKVCLLCAAARQADWEGEGQYPPRSSLRRQGPHTPQGSMVEDGSAQAADQRIAERLWVPASRRDDLA